MESASGDLVKLMGVGGYGVGVTRISIGNYGALFIHWWDNDIFEL